MNSLIEWLMSRYYAVFYWCIQSFIKHLRQNLDETNSVDGLLKVEYQCVLTACTSKNINKYLHIFRFILLNWLKIHLVRGVIQLRYIQSYVQFSLKKISLKLNILKLNILRILTGKKHPKIKFQRLRKIRISTFGSLVHQINSF